MLCRKCRRDITPDAIYCPYCRSKQRIDKHTRKTGNGLGYVYKRGTTYTLRMRNYVHVEGASGELSLRCIESTKGGFKTKKAAYEYRDALKGEAVRTGKKALSDYWLLFERDKLPKLSQSKQVNYRTAYKRLAPIQYRDISSLTVSDLQNVVSNSTTSFYPAHDMKVLLNKLFYMAAADGIVSKELPSFIELPKNEEAERKAFTLGEVNKIAELWEKGNLFSGYILLMIYSSMMPGELLGLRKSMIDLERQRIIGAGLKTKRRKMQSIVFPSFLISILTRIMQETPSDLLLDRYYYERFSNEFKATLRDAGCRELTPYACRHTTATVLSLNPDVAPSMIARIMRHSQRMTERYTHFDDKSAVAEVNKINPIGYT